MNAPARQLWRYSLQWRYPHKPCPALHELAMAEVPAGAPCPAEVMALWRPGGDYCISIDFGEPAVVRRWSDERKADARRRALARRVAAAAPLFTDELVERALADRPGYFAGKATR